MLTFDPKIDLGQIGTVVAMLGGVLIAWFNLIQQLAKTELKNDMRHADNTKRMDKMEDELEKQTDILVQLGTQKARLDGMDGRLLNLETDSRKNRL